VQAGVCNLLSHVWKRLAKWWQDTWHMAGNASASGYTTRCAICARITEPRRYPFDRSGHSLPQEVQVEPVETSCQVDQSHDIVARVFALRHMVYNFTCAGTRFGSALTSSF
jgi:hypothetical protein